MKNYVFILPDKDAGVASVVRNLIRYKSSEICAVVILLHSTSDNCDRRIKDNFSGNKVVRLTFNSKWSSRRSISKAIGNYLDNDSIIISNDGDIELEVFNYSNFNLPVIYIMHGDYEHYYNVLKKNGTFISSVITVSDYLKEQVLNLKNDFPKKFPFKVSSIKFPVPEVEEKLKAESEIIRIAFVGTLKEFKGVLKLKTIIDNLENRNINYHLNIIGSGPEKKKLTAYFKDNLNVTLTGSLSNEEVIKSHEQHDILLLPSSGEGLPVVVVEAMKCGVVPITTDLKTGIPELIEHAITGYTVSLNDIPKYADYIEVLYNDRKKLFKMSKMCRVKASDMFDPIRQTRSYEENFALAHRNISKSSFVRKMFGFFPMNIEHRLNRLIK